MNNDPRKDSSVPVVEFNDEELAKLVGGASGDHHLKTLRWEGVSGV